MTTTEQMLDAPTGAIYVWPCYRTMRYAENLARHLNRTDLKIVPSSSFKTPDQFAGRHFPGIIVDHAVQFTNREFQNYEYTLCRVRP